MTSVVSFKKIKEGDSKAFEQLFRNNYAGLVQFAWGYVRSKAIAEELVQDVFLKIWDNKEEIKVSKTIEAYLYKSVRNRCTDWARHSKIVKEWEKESIEELKTEREIPDKLSRDLHNRMLIEEIEKAIFQLPERRREVFLLSRYEQKSYKEIAEILMITVSTVETHMSKALDTLRKKFMHLLIFLMMILN